jgi:hypothetical protein
MLIFFNNINEIQKLHGGYAFMIRSASLGYCWRQRPCLCIWMRDDAGGADALDENTAAGDVGARWGCCHPVEYHRHGVG